MSYYKCGIPCQNYGDDRQDQNNTEGNSTSWLEILSQILILLTKFNKFTTPKAFLQNMKLNPTGVSICMAQEESVTLIYWLLDDFVMSFS